MKKKEYKEIINILLDVILELDNNNICNILKCGKKCKQECRNCVIDYIEGKVKEWT